MSTSILILVPLLVLPILLLLSFVGCSNTHFMTAGLHFTEGPTCTIEETSVTCEGELSAVEGDAEVALHLEAVGETTFKCVSGAKESAAATPNVPSHGSGTASYMVKGELIAFEVVAHMIVREADAGCKSNAKPTRTDATVTSLTLTVSQGGRVRFRCEKKGSFRPEDSPVHLECKAE